MTGNSTEKDFDLFSSKTEAQATFFKYLKEDHKPAYLLSLADRLVGDARRILQEKKPTPQIASRMAKNYHRMATVLLHDLQRGGVDVPADLLEWPPADLKKPDPTVTRPSVPTLNEVLPEGELTQIKTSARQETAWLDEILMRPGPDETLVRPVDYGCPPSTPPVDLPDLEAVVQEQAAREARAKSFAALHQAFTEVCRDFFRAPIANVIRPPLIKTFPSGDKALFLQTAKFQHAGRKCNWNAVVDGRVPTSGHALAVEGADGRALSEREYQGEGDDRYVRVLRVVDGTLIRYFLQVDDRNADQHARFYTIEGGELRALAPKEFWKLETQRKRTSLLSDVTL